MTTTILKKKSGNRKNAAQRELRNFANTVKLFKPREGSLPKVNGFDIFGVSLPKYTVGGDHITYLDFNTRFDLSKRLEQAKDNAIVSRELIKNHARAGIYVIDVKGHQDTDAFPAALLHQAFLSCAHYELLIYGQITPNIFEVLNTRFYKSSGIEKTISAMYGEINEDGTFKFISQGSPMPLVFSNEYNKLVNIKDITGIDFKPSEPIGFRPSLSHVDAAKCSDTLLGYKQPYYVNQIKIESPGDMLLIFTDGFSDNARGNNCSQGFYVSHYLEDKLRRVKHLPAKEVCTAIKKDLKAFKPNQDDDITYVVIKKK